VLAGLITGERRVELVEVPEPVALPGHAVVAVERCGICGTDVSAYKTGHPYTRFLHGHEWCGTVVAVGPDTLHPTGLAPGDRVVCGSPPPCGACAECRAGLTGRCARLLDIRGPGGEPPPQHGAYAERIALDARRLVPIPADLPADIAAQVEPAAVALHGVRRSPLRLGDVVVVQGCGPIGLLAVQVARAAGAGLVVAVEPEAARRSAASELGADVAVEPGEAALDAVRAATGGLGAAVVLDCAGTGPALDGAVRLARPSGWVTMVGVSSTPVTIDPSLWLVREITVATSLAHTWDDFQAVLALVADGRLQLAPLHSATVGLDGLADAFAGLAAADRGWCKVLVDPTA
jgi:(R,R)-butanediol dehydrogenase / meso-butanediol dehydrogenase / diacetyl reductase